MGLVTMGAIMGGHCRVALEDSIYLRQGQLVRSNAEQVAKIRTILNELSLEIATPTRHAPCWRSRARITSCLDANELALRLQVVEPRNKNSADDSVSRIGSGIVREWRRNCYRQRHE